jgi:hypothetical protein
MAVSAVNTTIAAENTITTVTVNAATSSVIDATEVFTLTPTKADAKVAIVIENGPTHGTITYSIAAGGFWAAGSALTGSVAQATTRVIVLEGGKYKAAAGTIAITFTPASGKRLLTDHAMSVSVIQLP